MPAGSLQPPFTPLQRLRSHDYPLASPLDNPLDVISRHQPLLYGQDNSYSSISSIFNQPSATSDLQSNSLSAPPNFFGIGYSSSNPLSTSTASTTSGPSALSTPPASSLTPLSALPSNSIGSSLLSNVSTSNLSTSNLTSNPSTNSSTTLPGSNFAALFNRSQTSSGNRAFAHSGSRSTSSLPQISSSTNQLPQLQQTLLPPPSSPPFAHDDAKKTSFTAPLADLRSSSIYDTSTDALSFSGSFNLQLPSFRHSSYSQLHPQLPRPSSRPPPILPRIHSKKLSSLRQDSGHDRARRFDTLFRPHEPSFADLLNDTAHGQLGEPTHSPLKQVVDVSDAEEDAWDISDHLESRMYSGDEDLTPSASYDKDMSLDRMDAPADLSEDAESTRHKPASAKSSRQASSNSKFSRADDEKLLTLKEDSKLTWKMIAQHFEGRSAGALQVRYCTRLKGRALQWDEDDVETLRRAVAEFEREKWTYVSKKLGGRYSASKCRHKFASMKKRSAAVWASEETAKQ